MYLNEVRNIHLLKVIVAQLLLRSKSVLLEKLKGTSHSVQRKEVLIERTPTDEEIMTIYNS